MCITVNQCSSMLCAAILRLHRVHEAASASRWGPPVSHSPDETRDLSSVSLSSSLDCFSAVRLFYSSSTGWWCAMRFKRRRLCLPPPSPRCNPIVHSPVSIPPNLLLLFLRWLRRRKKKKEKKNCYEIPSSSPPLLLRYPQGESFLCFEPLDGVVWWGRWWLGTWVVVFARAQFVPFFFFFFFLLLDARVGCGFFACWLTVDFWWGLGVRFWGDRPQRWSLWLDWFLGWVNFLFDFAAVGVCSCLAWCLIGELGFEDLCGPLRC